MMSLKKKKKEGKARLCCRTVNRDTKGLFLIQFMSRIDQEFCSVSSHSGMWTDAPPPPRRGLVPGAGGEKGPMPAMKCTGPEVTGISPVHNSKATAHHLASPKHKDSRTCQSPQAQHRICINPLLQRCKNLRVSMERTEKKTL